MKEKYKIHFIVSGNEHVVGADEGATARTANASVILTEGAKLIDIIRDNGFEIPADCGGFGTCGKCRVIVNGESRLACETIVDCDMDVELPGGDAHDYVHESLHDLTNSATNGKIPDSIAAESNTLHEKHGKLTGNEPAGASDELAVAIDLNKATSENNIHPVKCDKRTSGQLTVAIDLGTTTLAVRLIDIDTGKDLIVISETNAQRPYGADVISRINMSMDDPSVLRDIISKQLGGMISRAINDYGADTEQIKRVIIAGNTTMSYILAGLPCRSLGLAPFEPAYQLKDEYSYGELFGAGTLDAPVYIVPFISAYIGGDITAGLLTLIQNPNVGDSFMLVDMGTNGEIAYCANGKILCTSAAAGSAFEGGNISCGTGSIKGAISKLSVVSGHATDSDNPDVNFANASGARGATSAKNPTGVSAPENNSRVFACETIGNAPAYGICGSGLLDAMACFVREGIIDASGALNQDSPHVTEEGVTIAEGVTLTQKDIREFQLAKSAIRAGVEVLIGEFGGNPPKKYYIAGGFGQNLSPESAVITGLLPQSAEGNVTAIGNSSLAGATICARDISNADTAHSITKQGTEINLASHECFNKLFMEHMMF